MFNLEKINLVSEKRSFLMIPLAFIITFIPVMAHAALVDLSTWTENGFKGNLSAGNWNVQGANNDSVVQLTNGDPTVFFDANNNAQGTTLSGQITVETTSDDDFIGFVLGYQDGELDSTNADFWLIDWKQGDQSPAIDGLALSHVTGDIANGPGSFDSFWNHTNTVNEVQRATNLGSTGWNDNQTYNFDLLFTSTLIEIQVDGVTELSYSGSFTDGSFGFYNFSQAPVRYAGITEDVVVQTPEPSTLILFALSILGFNQFRRKNS